MLGAGGNEGFGWVIFSTRDINLFNPSETELNRDFCSRILFEKVSREVPQAYAIIGFLCSRCIIPAV